MSSHHLPHREAVERAVPVLLSPEWRTKEGASLSEKLQVGAHSSAFNHVHLMADDQLDRPARD